jgi:YkoY family integral membrane protein
LFDFTFADLPTIGLLVVLEGLLSADNALVLAILVMGLPVIQQPLALRYGLLVGFGLRALSVLLASYLMKAVWVKLAGGGYLLYLAVSHFMTPEIDAGSSGIAEAKPMLGLSAFWATIVRVEAINLAFSVDSILVAVAVSPKLSVVILGGILGIVAMRVVAGELIALIRKYPALIDGAFVIIGWVAIKLLLEYAHAMHWVSFEIPKSASLIIIAAIFLFSYLFARRKATQVTGSTK